MEESEQIDNNEFLLYILKRRSFPYFDSLKKKKKKCRIELKLRRYILESLVHYIPTKHFKKSLSARKKLDLTKS